MIWAVLAALGVPLWVIALALLALLWKRRRVAKLPEIFRCKVRVASGEIAGLKEKFRSAHVRWIHDVLVVYSGMGRTTVTPLPIKAVEHPFRPGDIKRMDNPQILALRLDGDAIAEVAVPAADQSSAVGPFLE